MSIPLVNSNNVNDINTSLIAIKKEINAAGNSEVNINVNYNVTEEVTSGVHMPVTSDGVYNAISTEASSRDTAITTAINALDVSSVGGSGKYIQSISESNGKIVATAADVVDSVTVNNMNSVSSNAVANYVKHYNKTISGNINIATTTGYRSYAIVTDITYDSNYYYIAFLETIEDINCVYSKENSSVNGYVAILMTAPKSINITNGSIHIIAIKTS